MQRFLSEKRPRRFGGTLNSILIEFSGHFLHSSSEKRDSNPRPPPWQGDALPLSYFRVWY